MDKNTNHHRLTGPLAGDQAGRAAPGEALGQSEIFLDFQERLSRVAVVNRPVLVVGERGTGKELAAVRLHYLSQRWQGPLVILNCAALAPALLESELFGHERGAFTGAVQRRRGRFEAAHEGTLFLDEIGNLPRAVQAKILRVVEYGSFERLGSIEPVAVDVRIVAATNADLKAMAESGAFMRDLLDRLSFEILTVPPLRQRTGDILLLANHFAARMAFELGRQKIPRFSRQAAIILEQYSWPGNVRELKNVVERAVYRTRAERIDDVALDPFHPSHPSDPAVAQAVDASVAVGDDSHDPLDDLALNDAVWELKVRRLTRALVQARHNQRRAARLLGLSYHQFRGLYRRYKERMRPSGEEATRP
jgi:psp operon transcriptional activator